MGGSSGKISWPTVDMSGKTVIVTGASTGIGYETAKQLAFMGATVILACRDEQKTDEAIIRMNTEYRELQKSKDGTSVNTDHTQVTKSNDVLPTNGDQTKENGDTTEYNTKTTGSSEQTIGNDHEATGYNQETTEKSDQGNGATESSPLHLEFLRLDLDSLDSVEQFCADFKSKGYPLDILICNAGIAYAAQGKTKDGFEKQFQINYLGHFLLILHLLPVMRNAGGDCRIINVSSEYHSAGSLDLTNIQGQRSYSRATFYGNSKLFQIMMMYALERRLKDIPISVFSVHPGMISSDIKRNFSDSTVWSLGASFVNKIGMMKDTVHGAATSILLAVSPDMAEQRGTYFSEGKPTTPSKSARNESDQEALWQYSLECLKDRVPPELLQSLES